MFLMPHDMIYGGFQMKPVQKGKEAVRNGPHGRCGIYCSRSVAQVMVDCWCVIQTAA
jgi:hypothetical protein